MSGKNKTLILRHSDVFWGDFAYYQLETAYFNTKSGFIQVEKS